MNFDRGLFRLWVVGSATWAIWCIIDGLRHWNAAFVDAVYTPDRNDAADLMVGVFVMWSLPSLLVLGIGLATIRICRWIVAGFRQ